MLGSAHPRMHQIGLSVTERENVFFRTASDFDRLENLRSVSAV
jgi:hypothetical protein